jgi:hypothetical protein
MARRKLANAKTKSPKPLPEAIVDMPGNFQRDAAENQAPQNQKKRKIIAGESGGHEPWKHGDQCTTEANEPHFMPRPQWPNRNHLPPLLGRSRDKPLQHSSAKVAPIQHYVNDKP